MRARKYLRKDCCHCIKCSTTNFLTALMWRRSLNSAALVTPTHRGLGRVSGGTSTQVMEMINKLGGGGGGTRSSKENYIM